MESNKKEDMCTFWLPFFSETFKDSKDKNCIEKIIANIPNLINNPNFWTSLFLVDLCIWEKILSSLIKIYVGSINIKVLLLTKVIWLMIPLLILVSSLAFFSCLISTLGFELRFWLAVLPCET